MTSNLLFQSNLILTEISPYSGLQDTIETTVTSGFGLFGILILVLIIAVILAVFSKFKAG